MFEYFEHIGYTELGKFILGEQVINLYLKEVIAHRGGK